jgi:hypothetical protein
MRARIGITTSSLNTYRANSLEKERPRYSALLTNRNIQKFFWIKINMIFEDVDMDG